MRNFTLLILLPLFMLALISCTSNSSDTSADGDAESSDADTSVDGDNDDSPPDGDSDTELDGDSDLELEDDSEAEQEPMDPWADFLPAGAPLKDMLGVSTHMKQSAGENDNRDFEFEKYAEIGGARIREDYHWNHIEPADDEWHMEAVATQVEMARENGTKVLAMLAYGVDWAMELENTSSIDPEEYAEFAGKVAETFCADIKEYEIWNEPNLNRFWKPEADAEHYGKMLVAASAAIHSACPDARVLFGGMSSWDETWTLERWGFLTAVAEAVPDLCEHFDVLGFHPYTFMQEPSPEHDLQVSEDIWFEGQLRQTEIARERLAAMGCPDKPLQFTEMGWPSYEVNERDQGRYLARSMLLAARDGVEAYYWYTFWDGEPITEGFRPHENYFGIFGWPGAEAPRRAKPSWLAMKGLYDMLGMARFARDLSPYYELPTDVYALAFIEDSGEIRLALWDGRDVPDSSFGNELPLNPDTTYELSLPLPEGQFTTITYDIAGNETGREAVEGLLEMTLTASVQYVVLQSN